MTAKSRRVLERLKADLAAQLEGVKASLSQNIERAVKARLGQLAPREHEAYHALWAAANKYTEPFPIWRWEIQQGNPMQRMPPVLKLPASPSLSDPPHREEVAIRTGTARSGSTISRKRSGQIQTRSRPCGRRNKETGQAVLRDAGSIREAAPRDMNLLALLAGLPATGRRRRQRVASRGEFGPTIASLESRNAFEAPFRDFAVAGFQLDAEIPATREGRSDGGAARA